MGKKKQSSKTYKVKRYIITGRGPGEFKTEESSKDRAKIERAFFGWGKQLPGADLQMVSPSGRVVKKRYAGVFRFKSEQKAYKERRRRRR